MCVCPGPLCVHRIGDSTQPRTRSKHNIHPNITIAWDRILKYSMRRLVIASGLSSPSPLTDCQAEVRGGSSNPHLFSLRRSSYDWGACAATGGEGRSIKTFVGERDAITPPFQTWECSVTRSSRRSGRARMASCTRCVPLVSLVRMSAPRCCGYLAAFFFSSRCVDCGEADRANRASREFCFESLMILKRNARCYLRCSTARAGVRSAPLSLRVCALKEQSWP